MHRRALDWNENTPTFRLIAGRKVLPDMSVSVETVSYHLQDWIVDAEYNRLSPRTIDSKRNALEKFIWWLQWRNLNEITPSVIKSFVAYLHNSHMTPEGRWQAGSKKPLTPRAVEVYFINVRAYLNWMVREHIIAENPANGVSVPKSRPPEIKPFTPEQVKMLFAACRKTDFPIRNAAILALFLDTGMRVSELCDLRIEDLTLETSIRGLAVIRNGKGGKARTVPFDRAAARALWNHLGRQTLDPTEHLFTGKGGGHGVGLPLTRSGVLSLFKTLQRISGIKNVRCSPHTCRHTFAIEYLRSPEGNLETLQLILGHEKLEMVLVYARLAETDVINRHRTSSPLNRILG